MALAVLRSDGTGTSSVDAASTARPTVVLAWLAGADTFWALPLDDASAGDVDVAMLVRDLLQVTKSGPLWSG